MKCLLFAYIFYSISTISVQATVFDYAHVNDFRYVHTPKQFFIHMKVHVKNVNILADVLLDKIEKNPKKYAELLNLPPDFKMDAGFRKLVTDYMALHDTAKVNTSKDFLTMYSTPDKPLIDELYKIYNQTFNDTNAEQFRIINNVINKPDKAVGENFLAKTVDGKEKWVRAFLQDFESTIDKIERSNNPIVAEELGRQVSSASEYLLKEKKRLQKLRKTDPEAFAKAHQKDLADYPDSKIVAIRELEKEFFKIYQKKAIRYNDYKRQVYNFERALKTLGVQVNYLDKYSVFQMMSNFEKLVGDDFLSINNEKTIAKVYGNFLLANDALELNKLKAMIKTGLQLEGDIMLELAKIDHAVAHKIPYSSRYEILYKTYGGNVCF